MYVLVKIFVRADVKNNSIMYKIAREKYIQMSFNIKCVLTSAPFCISVSPLRSVSLSLLNIVNTSCRD
jgi:hypothetical protein